MSLLLKPNRLGKFFMPTIHRVDGYVIRIYPNDHAPAHVHVLKGGGMAIICITDRVSVREVFKMKPNEVKQAIRIVEANREGYLRLWEEIHG